MAEPADQGPSSISPLLIIPVVLITMFAGVALAFVNAVTTGPIEASKKAEKANALAEVMPGFENDPTTDLHTRSADGQPLVFYVGRDGTEGVTGWGIESATETGYSGLLSLVFGIDDAGKVQGIRLLEMRETPGLGTKAGDADYLDQYLGKGLDDFDFRVQKDGGQVEAISGATITSRAVSLCITQGLEEYGKSFKGKSPPKAAIVEESAPAEPAAAEKGGE